MIFWEFIQQQMCVWSAKSCPYKQKFLQHVTFQVDGKQPLTQTIILIPKYILSKIVFLTLTWIYDIMWIYAATSSWFAESSLECWKFWQNLSCRVWYLPLLFHYQYKHHFLDSIQSWKKESKPKKPSRTAQFILHFCLFIESKINWQNNACNRLFKVL